MKRNRLAPIFTLLGFLVLLLLPLLAMGPSVAHAGGTIKIDDVRSVSIGMGLRTSFNMVEDAAPNKGTWSKDFTLENIRLYVSGQILQSVGFEFNTEYSPLSVVVDPGPPVGTE